VLDHNDGIRALWQGRAGHDFNTLSRKDSRFKVPARTKLADAFESRAGRLRIR
jgi:hypothetical protein